MHINCTKNLLKSNFSAPFQTILSGHKCILFCILIITHTRILSVRTLCIGYLFLIISKLLICSSITTADILTLKLYEIFHLNFCSSHHYDNDRQAGKKQTNTK